MQKRKFPGLNMNHHTGSGLLQMQICRRDQDSVNNWWQLLSELWDRCEFNKHGRLMDIHMEQSNSEGRKARKNTQLALLGLLGMVAIACFWGWLASPEPSFQGNPLSYWLQGMERQASPAMRDQSQKALFAMGTNAVPFLLNITCKQDPRSLRWLERFCARHSLAVAFWRSRGQKIMSAQYALQWLAQRKRVPSSEVIQRLKVSGLGESAAERLGFILANADPVKFKEVLELGEAVDRSIRLNAIRSLAGVRGLLSVDFDPPVTTLLINNIRRAQKESDREMRHAAEMVGAQWLVPR